MPRYIFQGHCVDGNGRAISSGTVTVTLAGTSTAATIYAADSGGSALSGGQTTSNASGYFKFYVDDGDYAAGQKFDVVISKTNFNSQTYEDVIVVRS